MLRRSAARCFSRARSFRRFSLSTCLVTPLAVDVFERTIARIKELSGNQYFWMTICFCFYGTGIYFSNIYIILAGMVPQGFAIWAFVPFIRMHLPRTKAKPHAIRPKSRYLLLPAKPEGMSRQWRPGLGFYCKCGVLHSYQCLICGMTREKAKKTKGVKWAPL